jgi:hypothetical protein
MVVAYLGPQRLCREHPRSGRDTLGLQEVFANDPCVELKKWPWRASSQILPV